MKKLILTLSIAIASFCSYAQNSDPWPTTGNVGIGTTTPATMLHVSGANVSGRGQLSITSANSTDLSRMTFYKGGTNTYMLDVYGDPVNSKSVFDVPTGFATTFSVQGSEKVRIDLSGNVGIGTTNTQVYSGYKTLTIGNNDAASAGLIKFRSTYNTGDGAEIYQGTDGVLSFNINTSTNVFNILPSGNVGIGTTNPSYVLDVNGAVRTGGSGGVGFASGNSTPTQIGDMTLGTSSSGGYNWMQSYGSRPLSINPLGNNVGIGTTIPDEKLTVKGNIHAEEVKVDLSVPGADYVFEADYKLTSLTELKRYVDQNHHLPEIPSAKEIEKNGIQLGDMNMKLLKKVEELTLYLIEKDKQVTEQNKLLADQQKINQSLQEQINQLKNK